MMPPADPNAAAWGAPDPNAAWGAPAADPNAGAWGAPAAPAWGAPDPNAGAWGVPDAGAWGVQRLRGTVKKYDFEAGFGFITPDIPDKNGRDVFIHHKQIEG